MHTTPTPPRPKRIETTSTIHGETRVDPYAWMRDREDPDVTAYLTAENAYTEARLAHLAPLREQLFQEFRSHIVETDLSVPVRRGPWWYYTRTVEGSSYPIHCRRPAGAADEQPPLDPPHDELEQILYDENVEAQGHDFFEVGILSVSPDHNTLAIATDTVGNERYTLSFRHLDGSPAPAESVANVSYGFCWANDSATCLYTTVDDAWRPHQIWRHHLGQEQDVLVIQEDDQAFGVSVGRSRDDAIISIGVSSSVTSESLVLDANAPSGPAVVVAPRVAGVEHGLEHLTLASGARWWLKVHNEDAQDFRIDIAPVGDGAPQWSPWIPHRPGTRIEGIDAFERYVVISEREAGETLIRVIALEEDGLPTNPLEQSFVVTTQERPGSTWLGANPESAVTSLRIGQTSMISPSAVLSLDLATQATILIKQQVVPGGYNQSDYVCYRTWASAPDDTLVPVSVVHRRSLLADPEGDDLNLKQPAPCLLYGYGAYEISMDPGFSAMRLGLLDRGVVYAIAHVRGGGEMGRAWYDDGHLLNKHHSFSDFIACADHLIAKGITTAAQLCGEGRSAGGLLMGAVANQGGDRFAGILAGVPFVDALNSMLDPSLPLTVGEYDEWGNPTDDEAAYRAIRSYSPYDNVIEFDADGSAHRYPAMLITGGLNDTRVGYWEPAKFAARLRDANDANDVLLRMEMGTGHGGPSGRYDSWREEAFTMAWLLDVLGAAS